MKLVSVPINQELINLVQDADLDVSDLFKGRLVHFFAAIKQEQMLGVIGLEVHGKIGLLRSLSVQQNAREKGLGTTLVEHLENQARANHVQELYLLTNTAEAYFNARGYHLIERADAPAELKSTTQFSDLCPASAAVMRKCL